jgi:integrase
MPEDITRDHDRARSPWLSCRCEQPVPTPQTRLTSIRFARRTAARLGIPCSTARVPKRQRQPYFTDEQFRRIIRAAPARFHVMFTLLAGTGLRIGEAVALHIGDSKRTLLVETSKGTPFNDGSIRNRVLKPLLKRLGIPHAGLHAFRHGRVTVLRKKGTPADLQTLWIGHSNLRTGIATRTRTKNSSIGARRRVSLRSTR